MNTLVKPEWPVKDYRTWVNGIKKEDLEGVEFTLRHAQMFMNALCSNQVSNEWKACVFWPWSILLKSLEFALTLVPSLLYDTFLQRLSLWVTPSTMTF